MPQEDPFWLVALVALVWFGGGFLLVERSAETHRQREESRKQAAQKRQVDIMLGRCEPPTPPYDERRQLADDLAAYEAKLWEEEIAEILAEMQAESQQNERRPGR